MPEPRARSGAADRSERRVARAARDVAEAATRARYRALDADIAEFPLSDDAARDARAAGEPVVLGAPNVVRGGSHTGALDARGAIVRGLCTVLASDYYHPAPFAATVSLVRDGVLPLESAWSLVSANPATALGLHDRGRLAPGTRADLLLVEHEDGLPRAVVASVAAGELFWCGARLRERLRPRHG